jgi:hypothetical protein
MNTAFKPLCWILFWSAMAGIAVGGLAAAQEAPPATPSSGASQSAPATQAPGAKVVSPPKSTAQIDAGEPRANTSPPAPSGVSGTSSAASGPAAGVPAAGTPAPGKPAAGTQPAAARAPKAAGQKPPGGVDRLELNTATVTGDREQPKVMYIVPWKSSDIGDLSGKPMNSLLDEALAPVDRDEFKREVVYFDVVKADRSQNGTSGPAAKQGEK